MKKLLFNQARTKIFNLEQVVCIERIDMSGCRAIMLHFANGFQFFVTYSKKAMDYIRMWGTKDSWFSDGNFEINEKLFQYFENKFLKPGLCQKGANKNED